MSRGAGTKLNNKYFPLFVLQCALVKHKLINDIYDDEQTKLSKNTEVRDYYVMLIASSPACGVYEIVSFHGPYPSGTTD